MKKERICLSAARDRIAELIRQNEAKDAENLALKDQNQAKDGEILALKNQVKALLELKKEIPIKSCKFFLL